MQLLQFFSLKDVVKFFYAVKESFVDLAQQHHHAIRTFSNQSGLLLLTVQWQCGVLQQRSVLHYKSTFLGVIPWLSNIII